MGTVSANSQRASVFGAMPTDGWGHTLGFWGGKPSGGSSPSVKLAIWDTDGSGNPDDRLAYNSGVTVNAVESFGGDGQAYEVAVANVNSSFSPSTNAVALHSGSKYALGFVSANFSVNHAMTAAANLGSSDNKLFYNRSSISTPANPNGYTSSATNGHMTVWIEYQANRTPSATIVAPSGTITDTSPAFFANFSDSDQTYGDVMSLYQIQIYKVSDGSLKWDSGVLGTSASEKTAAQYSRAYGGSVLQAGVQYKWRTRVADYFGEWSAWTGYTTFTINAGGNATPTSPTGKQNSRQPSPFTASYSHGSSLSTNAVQVRIKQGSTVILDSGTISDTTANGGTISKTWSTLFSTNNLQWGVSNYTWEIRARDTTSTWGEWSNGKAFTTNNAPSVPTIVAPKNSAVSSSRPLLRATASDADGDTVTVKARIKDSGGTVLQTRTMTLVGSEFQYQTVSGDLAAPATFKWDAYSYDGSLYSGAETVEANATKSAEATFIYGSGPVVTITAPTTTVTVANPLVTWTASGQVKYQVKLYETGTTTLVYDSGQITSATQSHTIPSGYIINGESYDLTVDVTNATPLTGTSSITTFTVAYTPPATITSFLASPQYQTFDLVPSSIRLTWDASAATGFSQYILTRRETGQDTSQAVVLDRLTNQATTEWTDYMPVSGVEYTYSIVQATITGLDEIQSAAAESQTQIDLEYAVLVNVFDAGTYRVNLRLDSERGFDHIDDLVLEQTWGRSKPVGIYGTTQYDVFNGTFTLATDEVTSAANHINALRDLWKSRATICYRDERGRKFFAKITKFTEKDRRIQYYTVSLTLTEVHFAEGVDEI